MDDTNMNMNPASDDAVTEPVEEGTDEATPAVEGEEAPAEDAE